MIKHLVMGLFAAVSVVAASGCGADPCAKQADCAKKAGTAFSETEGLNSAKTDREKAVSLNCGSQYDDLSNCIAGLTCDQLSSLDAIVANCGAKVNAYNKCVTG